MTIYQSLKNDHDNVEELLQKLRNSQGGSANQSTFQTMKMELIVHSKAEEKVFYSALRDHSEARDLVQHAKTEHQKVEDLLQEMSSLDLSGEDFQTRLEELRSAVEDHVEEEEGEMFDLARKLITNDEARRLDEAFQEEKQNLQRQLPDASGGQTQRRARA
jgi:hemerythrin superfamily protein